MLLLGVREENGWLLGEFKLTYNADWENICKAVRMAYDYYDQAEVLIEGKKTDVTSKEEVMLLKESGEMTLRGWSKIIGVPLMVTFFNQLQIVKVSVACATDEFKEADYQKFNMSLGQYMDSMELAMYR